MRESNRDIITLSLCMVTVFCGYKRRILGIIAANGPMRGFQPHRLVVVSLVGRLHTTYSRHPQRVENVRLMILC